MVHRDGQDCNILDKPNSRERQVAFHHVSVISNFWMSMELHGTHLGVEILSARQGVHTFAFHNIKALLKLTLYMITHLLHQEQC